MFFEVMVPGARTKGFDEVMQIDAPDWRAAYNAAMAQSGQQADLRGAFVEVGNASVRVVDPVTRRVVSIRQLAADEARVSQMMAAQVPLPPPPVAPAGPARSVGFTDRATGTFKPIGAADIAAAKQKATNTGVESRILQQAAVPSAPTDDTSKRVPDAAVQMRTRLDSRSTVAALEDVFLEIPQIFDGDMAMEDAIDFVIDLAMKHVPSEHAMIFFASDMADHLYVAAARGAREKALGDAQISIHEGIPAESLRNGVSLALVEPARDTRYRPELAKFGVNEKNLIASPVQHGDRAFGVIVMANRVGADYFAAEDSNVVSYIGLQMGRFIEMQLEAAPLE